MFGLTPYRRHGDMMSEFNPFRDFDEMERRFFGENSLAAFKTDIRDNGKDYILEADLPGFNKEDIKLDLQGDNLVITAERKNEYKENNEDAHYLKCERSYGSYQRSFDVSGIKQEDIKAAYKDGVLTLTLPKREETTPTSRRLEIE